MTTSKRHPSSRTMTHPPPSSTSPVQFHSSLGPSSYNTASTWPDDVTTATITTIHTDTTELAVLQVDDFDKTASRLQQQLPNPPPIHILDTRPTSPLQSDPDWWERQSLRVATEPDKVVDETFDVIATGTNGETKVVIADDLQFLLATSAARWNVMSTSNSMMIPAAIQSLLQGRQYLDRNDFRQLFEEASGYGLVFGASPSNISMKESKLKEETTTAPLSQRLVTAWHCYRRVWLWMFLYVTASVVVCLHKLHQIRGLNHPALSWALLLAKGTASLLNLNGCLILLPVARHFTSPYVWTLLPNCMAHFVQAWALPAESYGAAHRLCGIMILVCSLLHTAGHLVGYIEFSRVRTAQDLEKSIGGLARGMPPSVDTLPTTSSGRWALLLSLRATWTGIAMLLCLVIAYAAALPDTKRQKHFNRFWWCHQLLILFLVLQCVHGTGNLLQRYQSVWWLVVPLGLIYGFPRIYRELSCSRSVQSARVVGGPRDPVVHLVLAQPTGWRRRLRRYCEGSYAMINIPDISRVEWHPITLSSCPDEDTMEFHIRCAGDWTGKLKTLVDSKDGDVERGSAAGRSQLRVRLEGPFGTPIQNCWRQPVIVLIGAGIGITPMISVLKQLFRDPSARNTRAVYLYWSAPYQSCFEWFHNILREAYLYQQEQELIKGEGERKSFTLQVRSFLTSARPDRRDVGAILFHHAATAVHRSCQIDLLTGQHAKEPVQVGRPNWKKEMTMVAQHCHSIGENMAGVFLCGPAVMAWDVQKACVDVSNESMQKWGKTIRMDFSKETF